MPIELHIAYFHTFNGMIIPITDGYYGYDLLHEHHSIRAALFGGTQSGRVCRACLPMIRPYTSKLKKTRHLLQARLPTCGFCKIEYPQDELYIQVTRSDSIGWEKTCGQRENAERWVWSERGKRWIEKPEWMLCTRCIHWLRRVDAASQGEGPEFIIAKRCAS